MHLALPPQVRRRTKRLLKLLALPGWVLVALGWGRQLLALWDELEFGWDKLNQYSVPRFLFSQVGLTVTGILWLGYLLLRPDERTLARQESEVDLRLPTMRRLLNEAAADLRRIPGGTSKTIDQATRRAWRELRVASFLAMACDHRIPPDLEAFVQSEHEKWKEAGGDFNSAEARAIYVERLSKVITEDQLDPGFHLPETYEQFARSEKWPPNRRG